MTDNDFRNHTVNLFLISAVGYGTLMAYRSLYPKKKSRAKRTTKILKRRSKKKLHRKTAQRITTVRMFHTHTPRNRLMYKAADWIDAHNKLKVRSKKKGK